MLRVQAVRIPMRDGVELAADVIAPGTGRGPALVLRTPYGRESPRIDDDVIGLARKGWSIVIQDVRGRGDSQGEFTPFEQEITDGADTVNWCRSQSWCSGEIAIYGSSYCSSAAWLATVERPSGLRALTSRGGAGPQLAGWAFEGGIALRAYLRSWALRFAATDTVGDPVAAERAAELLSQSIPAVSSKDEFDRISELFPAYRSWNDPQSWASPAVSTSVAGFHMVGWYDVFCEPGLRAYAEAKAVSDPNEAPQRLVVGPWAHHNFGSEIVGDLNLGPGANSRNSGVIDEQFEFLRAALDPFLRSELGHSVSVYVMGAESWRDLEQWPPPATEHSLYLGSDAMMTGAPGQSGDRRFVHDPNDPVPSVGGRLDGTWPKPGPIDQRLVEDRADVLVYTSDVVTDELDVIGPVTAELTITSDVSPVDLVLKLCDVHPDGTSYNLTEFGQRCEVTPGQPTTLTLQVGSTGWRMRLGHRARLHIAGASAPRLQVNPARTEVTVHHNADHPSRLILPVAKN